jgi:tetratricopeptide (TPR) repeat protein
MSYDPNLLEQAARRFMAEGEFAKAIRIYLSMADGDPSLDGGYLGEKIGECYEALGQLDAAKYWYGRAVEENPEVRTLARARRQALAGLTLTDIVPEVAGG